VLQYPLGDNKLEGYLFMLNWQQKELNYDSTKDLNTQFEQATVSPHVNQFLADYLFTRTKLIANDINPLVESSAGDCDLALSLINDAYNHQHIFEKENNELLRQIEAAPQPSDPDDFGWVVVGEEVEEENNANS